MSEEVSQTQKDALKRAIEALVISDIYLHSCKVELRNDYQPKLYHQGNPKTNTQFAWGPDSSELMLLKQDGSEETRRMWFLKYRTIYRLLKDAGKELPTNYVAPEDEILAQVEAVFTAEYDVKMEVDEDALREFALRNASYHIWPYWREFLHAACQRTSMPRVTLPMLTLAPPTQSHHKEPHTTTRE